MDMIIFFLPFVLLLGLVTSYEDVRFGKIRNVWIVAALALSIIIHSILFFAGQLAVQYLVRISLFTFFSIIIGFTMFMLGLWSPGDAKLFTAYISLYPLAFYRYVSTMFWPLDILANTFVPVFIFIIFQTVVKLKKEQLVVIFKNILSPVRIFSYLLSVFSFSWITMMILGYFNLKSDFLVTMLGITFFSYLVRKIFSDESLYIMLLIAVLRVFLNYNYIMRPVFWESFLLMSLVYFVIMVFISELGSLYTKKADINFLKEGMQPVQFIIKRKNQYFRSDKIIKDAELVYEQKPEGLTDEDIGKIQNLHRSGFLHFNHIAVQQSVPFAPFIFAGVLLGLLVKGNIIIFIRSFF